MKEKQVNQVREHLARYLTEAERGEEIVVTRHSKPVAKIVPYEKKQSQATLPDLATHRQQVSTKGAPLSDDVINLRDEERY